jgi:(1->4)-alpha-D-glucan 1-alpha-D-glucosylmutase
MTETTADRIAEAQTGPPEYADAIWQSVVVQLAEQQAPTATYRLQFNADFTFRDATRLLPYFAELGISHIYASPYLKACAGSMHGYDIADYSRLNPELGTDEDFEEFVRGLRQYGLKHILDFVPNHMGVSGNENEWWADVLENGPASRYAAFFDIDWMPLKPDLAFKVLLPVLGDQFGKVLESGQLRLVYAAGDFRLEYYNRNFPICPRSRRFVLEFRLEELEQQLGPEQAALLEYKSIVTAIRNLPLRTEVAPDKVNERYREKEIIRRRLQDLSRESPEIEAFLQKNVEIFNGTPGDPPSFDLLDELLEDQAYRLSYWRVARDEINYRRFFDINDLAAICMEDPRVFKEAHRKVLELIDRGVLHGLRIDHADGLYDPTAYLRELQRCRFRQLCRKAALQLEAPLSIFAEDAPDEPSAGSEVERNLLERFESLLQQAPVTAASLPLYVVVEKILEPGEELPAPWPVHGTSGYDFLTLVNGLFVNAGSAAAIGKIYSRWIHAPLNFDELSYAGRKLIVRTSMSSEISVLGYQLDRLSERDRHFRDFTLNGLTDAIEEIIACFPVYRTYITPEGVLERDRRYVDTAVARAKHRNPAMSAAIFDFVRDMLLLHFPPSFGPDEMNAQLRFAGRFQQVTGPVTAKGIEDTAFYAYHRLISLNEVGGSPKQFGISVENFHERCLRRLAKYPYSLSATSTHDTKRSEDVRARVNVLSEIPQAWKSAVNGWGRLNRRKKKRFEGEEIPSRNDEYLLYQTLVGTWPIGMLSQPEQPDFEERIQAYMLKAVREAKEHSSWISPSEPYEGGLHSSISTILSRRGKNEFLVRFADFAEHVAETGIWNSLSQLTVKCTAPGVPDIYRGTEFWDFSLVDPDNRRPVDFSKAAETLREFRARLERGEGAQLELAQELSASRGDGRIKLYVLWQLLTIRRTSPRLCTVGEYVPLHSYGDAAAQVCSYARILGDDAIVVVVPRLTASFRNLQPAETMLPPGEKYWGDTRLQLPPMLAGNSFRNIFTGSSITPSEESGQRCIPLTAVFDKFPVGVFTAR